MTIAPSSNWSRRRFLQTAVAVGAARIAVDRTGAGEQDAEADQVWALLSDTHAPEDAANEYRGFHPQATFKRAAIEVARARPRGVIITGDVARLEGLAGDYAAVQRLLAPLREAGAGVHACMGNHDDRVNYLASLAAPPAGQQEVPDKLVTLLDAGGVRLILLDSLLLVNQVPGLLGKAQRDWLAAYLASSDARPTLLLVHHTLGDGDGELLDADRLFALIKPHRKVKAIFFGHSHVYAFGERDGVLLVNLPACGYNFDDDQPVGWVEASFTAGGARLTLHALGGNVAGDG